MSLINMAIPDEGPEEYEPHLYGHGLCIRLNPKQCAALGITAPPEAGRVFSLKAMATATCVTQEVDLGEEDKEVYLEMQITDLEIGKASNVANASSMLYGPDTD